MRCLVDTQALIWYVDQDYLVSVKGRAAITDPANELLLSAASIWEIAIKVGLRKLRLSMSYRMWMDKAIADLGIVILPITVDYAEVQSQLPRHHGDPFDRLIMAQALVESVPVISSDLQLDAYGINRVW